jgi:hypothetical protein
MPAKKITLVVVVVAKKQPSQEATKRQPSQEATAEPRKVNS